MLKKSILRSGPQTKWGSAVSGGALGYQTVPDVLIRNQAKLGLTPIDMMVLLNITLHWWEREPGKMPHPRPSQIATRMGTTPRTVQRSIKKLCSAGLVKWLPPEKGEEGISVRRFEVTGLVHRLQAIAEMTLAQQPAA